MKLRYIKLHPYNTIFIYILLLYLLDKQLLYNFILLSFCVNTNEKYLYILTLHLLKTYKKQCSIQTVF